MIWFGRHISLWNNAYNCTMNDPMVYMGAHGWRRLLAKAQFIWNRRTLKRMLNNYNLGDSIVVSERAVEIPLAIDFLNTWVRDEPVMELGCVLPYYIFKSPNHIVYDLMDIHPANTRKDLRELDLEDFRTNVISISTLEHISKGDYGINQTSVTAVDVLCKIRDNAKGKDRNKYGNNYYIAQKFCLNIYENACSDQKTQCHSRPGHFLRNGLL